jgi:hypothetical protein
MIFQRTLPSAFLATLLLAGCTTVPVTSLVALSKIDAMTSDLSRLRIALAAPEALRPRPGGVKLDVKVVQGNNPPESLLIALDETVDAADMVGLPQADRPGQSMHVYRLSQKGVADLARIRQEAQRQKAEKKRGSLSIGVSAKEFCLAAPLPDGALPVTTWLLTSETQSYVPVTRDVDLRSDASIAKSLQDMPPCAGAFKAGNWPRVPRP